MANYIISYDLNGPFPSHAMVDKHIATLGFKYGRILETVWYVASFDTLEAISRKMSAILSPNDQLAVIEAHDMWCKNLLVSMEELKPTWQKAA